MMDDRTVWSYAKAVDTSGPAFLVRTYLEQMDIRQYLAGVAAHLPIRAACDVGAGYGRLSVVLAEYAPRVVAFEREAEFVVQAHQLLPQIDFQQVMTLSQLPADSHIFQFVLTFTVLQHLNDSELIGAIAELKRIVARPGYVLLCEETDSDLSYDASDSPEGGSTRGRTVEQYAALMTPLTLRAITPRRVEPTYPRQDVGTYMLFQSADR